MWSLICLSWKKFTLLWEHERDGGVWKGLFPLLDVLIISNSASAEGFTFSVTLFAGLLKAFLEGEDNHCSTLEVISDAGHSFCTICCQFQCELWSREIKQLANILSKIEKTEKTRKTKHALSREQGRRIEDLTPSEFSVKSIILGICLAVARSLSFTGDIFQVISSPPSNWLCCISYQGKRRSM